MNDRTGKANLMGMGVETLKAFFVAHGEKPFRAVQTMQWIHQRGVADFAAMTDLARGLRAWLVEHAEVRPPEIVSEQLSADGTRKWLLRLEDGQCIETVFIARHIPVPAPSGVDAINRSGRFIPEDDRGTLCISSQVGCALNCGFCSTARQGFNRDLTAAEIVGQLWIAQQRLGVYDGDDRGDAGGGERLVGPYAAGMPHSSLQGRTRGVPGQPLPATGITAATAGRLISNVVFMGMGEPLLNFDNVVEAIGLMLDDNGYGLSKRRVTVSTAGVAPAIDRLREATDVSLALSLHAPDDALRSELMPLNRKYPLAEVLAACRRYVEGRHQRVTVEYVLLEGVNDSPAQARALARLLRDLPCKVNLIPFNPFPQALYRRSPPTAVECFRDILVAAGYITITRRTRGDDIDAACGQLAGRVTARGRYAARPAADPGVAPAP